MLGFIICLVVMCHACLTMTNVPEVSENASGDSALPCTHQYPMYQKQEGQLTSLIITGVKTVEYLVFLLLYT